MLEIRMTTQIALGSPKNMLSHWRDVLPGNRWPLLASVAISFPYPVTVTYEVLGHGQETVVTSPGLHRPHERLQKKLSRLKQECLAGEWFLGIYTGSFNLEGRTAISPKAHPHLNPYHIHAHYLVLVWAAGSERLWRRDIIWIDHDP